MTKLQRTTFEISRAAEYFDARQLSALVGVSQDEFAGVGPPGQSSSSSTRRSTVLSPVV